MPGGKKNSSVVQTPALDGVSALVLCGGLGTRLRQVVADRPKSMAEVAGRPFLEYLLQWLGASGIRDVVLCTGYKADAVQEHFGEDLHYGKSLQYSNESEPLGTAGALKLAERYIKSDAFVVLNGDSALDVDLPRMVLEHSNRKASATMALARAQKRERYGRVWLDEEGRVTAFAEKDASAPVPNPAVAEWINGGVYIFDRTMLSLIPEAPRPFSLETDLLPQLIGNGLYGFRSEGYFIDIGVPEDFARAQEELPRRFSCVPSNSC